MDAALDLLLVVAVAVAAAVVVFSAGSLAAYQTTKMAKNPIWGWASQSDSLMIMVEAIQLAKMAASRPDTKLCSARATGNAAPREEVVYAQLALTTVRRHASKQRGKIPAPMVKAQASRLLNPLWLGDSFSPAIASVLAPVTSRAANNPTPNPIPAEALLMASLCCLVSGLADRIVVVVLELIPIAQIVWQCWRYCDCNQYIMAIIRKKGQR